MAVLFIAREGDTHEEKLVSRCNRGLEGSIFDKTLNMKNLIKITDQRYFALLFKVKQTSPLLPLSVLINPSGPKTKGRAIPFNLAGGSKFDQCTTYSHMYFNTIVPVTGINKKRLRGTEFKKIRYKHAVEIE